MGFSWIFPQKNHPVVYWGTPMPMETPILWLIMVNNGLWFFHQKNHPVIHWGTPMTSWKPSLGKAQALPNFTYDWWMVGYWWYLVAHPAAWLRFLSPVKSRPRRVRPVAGGVIMCIFHLLIGMSHKVPTLPVYLICWGCPRLVTLDDAIYVCDCFCRCWLWINLPVFSINPWVTLW